MVRSVRPVLGLVAGALLAATPTLVHALRQPAHLERRPVVETGPGVAPVRDGRDVRWDAPADGAGASALAAWKRAHGDKWRVRYDDQTDVPLRIYGEGIAVPGSVADGALAERAARALLAQHVGLLAPGADPAAFTLLVNDHQPTMHMRSLALGQTAAGLPVLGAKVAFTFKHDRLFMIGSTAIPHVVARVPAKAVPASLVAATAEAWLRADVAGQATLLGDVAGPFVLPLVTADGAISSRTVFRATFAAEKPVGRWDVYVDAQSGERVARQQTLSFATATVNYDVPDRYPQKGRLMRPARGANLGNGIVVGADGKINFTGTTAQVTLSVSSSFVKVLNLAGSVLSSPQTVTDGQTLTYSRASNEFDDAQLQAFVSVGIAKARLKQHRPQLTWIDQSINARVNENDVCNAYSDGTHITFFRKGSSQGLACENTGRILDVVMHEYGHSFHSHVITTGSFDGALSEGISDYVSIDITEDPGMGRGFFSASLDEAMRHADETPEATWPSNAPIHTKGIIIAGALWDARKNFKAAKGQAGADELGVLFADALSRADDIPSMYDELLASDDDDGNIANGTPNKCLIDEAFARHNLAEPGADTGPSVGTPELTGLHVVVPVTGGQSAACPGKAVESAKLDWKVRGGGPSGSTNLTMTAAGLEGDLPSPATGVVLNYQITVTFADATTQVFPDNAADPFYEKYLGDVEVIYCTNFDSDPFAAGWTHELVSGMAGEGADDWQWGTPAGEPGSGDPKAAFTGSKVIGNDMGGTIGGQPYNGQYQASKVNRATSPVIDLMGHTSGVRLQYRRWLNVEDGSKDQGRVLVDGQVRWSNTSMGAEHTDREWRFHDLDLSADAADGSVQVAFELASDASGNRGGWNVDDFCVVATSGAMPGPVCGNGTVEAGETCDDGNTTPGDGCSGTCQSEPGGPMCGDGTQDTGETCDDGNTSDGDGCSSTCQTEGGGGDDGGDGDNAGDGSDGGNDASGGCACRAGGGSAGDAVGGLLLAVLVGGVLMVRRRRSTP